MDQASSEQIKEIIYDQKWFTARALLYLHNQLNISIELIVQLICGFVFLLSTVGSNCYFIPNAILVLIPTLLFFVFPEERPSRDQLLIYWSCFGLLTLVDRDLEVIPMYYIMKMALLCLLFLEPYRFAKLIKQTVSRNRHGNEMLNNDESNETKNRSPPPEKPEMPLPTPMVVERTPISHAPSPLKKEDSSENHEQTPAYSTVSRTDMPHHERYKGPNPMTSDSNYELKSTASSTGISNKEIGPGFNLKDLSFLPGDQLVFNAPFDNSVTYHMKMTNNAHHRIAYAIKGNAVPRIVAYPPSGIIRPKESQIIAVTLQKFDYNSQDFVKDRIVFEYILLKESQKDVTQFSHSLLQTADIKQRKNIYIKYNS